MGFIFYIVQMSQAIIVPRYIMLLSQTEQFIRNLTEIGLTCNDFEIESKYHRKIVVLLLLQMLTS